MLLRILLSMLLLPAGIAMAQVKMSAETRDDLQSLSAQWKKQGQFGFKDLSARYPVYHLQGQYVVSVLAKTNAAYNPALLAARHISVGSRSGTIVTLKIPLDELDEIAALPGIDLLEMAGKVQPHLDKAIKDIRADSVHGGYDLPQAYTGKDVYIGITDWGFDYTHPMFYDTAMAETRIAAAWDQYKQSGPAPAGYTYGTEYQTPQQLLAAGSDTANIYSYNYHGSHVAGIAGGGGAGTPYRGVAFESQFLFATFLIDAGSVLDAYAWMYQKAQVAQKRLVINQSWGLHHIGNLDGTSLLSQAIDNYSDLGVVFATSGGNNGDVNFHISKTFAADTLKTKVAFYPYSANPNMWGQSLTLWGEPDKSFAVSIQVLNGSNLLLGQTPFYNTATTNNYVDAYFLAGTDTVFYNISAEAANPQNDRPHMRFRVKCTNANYKVIMRVAAADGTVHAWNVVELTNDVGNWGLPFTSIGFGYTSGNKDYGIGEPACTESVISVAAYASSFYNGPNLVGGAIAAFSSFGPTLDERVKPDIAAPGVSIASSVSSFTDSEYTPLSESVPFGIRTYHFTRISGTSMSSPVVAGVIALILEANPTLSPEQVKDILIQTARTDNSTGVIPPEGSLRWGHGKINAYKAVQLALETTSVPTVLKDADFWRIYPNPTSGQLSVSGLTGGESYQLLSLDGKVLQSGFIQAPVLELTTLQSGMYLLVIRSSRGKQAFQVIKQ